MNKIGYGKVKSALTKAIKEEQPKEIAIQTAKLSSFSKKQNCEFSNVLRVVLVTLKPSLRERLSGSENESISSYVEKVSIHESTLSKKEWNQLNEARRRRRRNK